MPHIKIHLKIIAKDLSYQRASEVIMLVEKTIRSTKMAILFIFLCSSSYIVTALMLNEPGFLGFASIGYAMCLSLYHELKTLKRLYVKTKES